MRPRSVAPGRAVSPALPGDLRETEVLAAISCLGNAINVNIREGSGAQRLSATACFWKPPRALCTYNCTRADSAFVPPFPFRV